MTSQLSNLLSNHQKTRLPRQALIPTDKENVEPYRKLTSNISQGQQLVVEIGKAEQPTDTHITSLLK
jgi:hypothetical protein